MSKVIRKIEKQLNEPLKYDGLHLEWLTYFPSIALSIDGLKLGPDKAPFIEGGHVDIVLRLFPLLKEEIIIRQIRINDSRLRIIKEDATWSYDIFRKSDSPSDSEWKMLVNTISLETTTVIYDDKEGLSLMLDIADATLEGMLSGKLIDANIDMRGSLLELASASYQLPAAFSVDMSGNNKHDLEKGTQEYNRWTLKNNSITFEGEGSTQKKKGEEWINATIRWKNGDIKALQQFIPDNYIPKLDGYSFSGDSEGQLRIDGKSSGKTTPHISCDAMLNNGSVQYPGEDASFNHLALSLTYDNGHSETKGKSFLSASLKQGSVLGNTLNGEIRIRDLDQPALTLDMTGSMPATLLNLFSSSSSVHFQKGVFEIDHLKLDDLRLENVSLYSFVEKSETAFSLDKIKFIYHQDAIEITQGEIHIAPSGKMNLNAETFIWNKAKGEDIKGEFNFISEKVVYEITGSICQGEVESSGMITGIGARPILDADWKMKGVEIKEIMASFENFGQTFITSDHIKGKTNIWAHTLIPYDSKGNILTQAVGVRAAINVSDGQLKDMKILEDFSNYVHLDDLRDIRFNEFRNYMKIEAGKVYLPVMFIQSSAINMSINGVHGFDQQILYNLKINAGQAAANKLRKLDYSKRFKQARKSGWINFYYVLSGSTSSVHYEQDQKEVLSGFEQSAALKESLRTYLVDHFGYDVYWLEPNEWEDIPEYR